MTRLLRLLIIGWALVLLVGSCTADVPKGDACKTKFSSVVFRLNRILKSRNLPTITYNSKLLAVFISPDYLRKIQIAQVSVPGLGVDIIPASLEVIAFQRDIPVGSGGTYEAVPKPKWSAEEAEKQSRFWYENLIGKLPNNLGKPLAQFDPQTNLTKNRFGLWNICWPRVDAQGHPFAQDAINITLSEKFGLIGFANTFASKFTEGQKISVSQQEAITAGRSVALKMLESPMASEWSKGLVLQDKASAELWIVNPNHILEHNGIEDTALASDQTARLAWIVTYRASNDRNMGSNVLVWIDAETKEVLGGDFQ